MLKEKKRGVSSEDKKFLSDEQEKEVQRKIMDVMPSQYKLDFALRTRKAVQELIFQEFQITLATTTGDYLRKWGFRSQKPKKKAYEQQPSQFLDGWMNNIPPSRNWQRKKRARHP